MPHLYNKQTPILPQTERCCLVKHYPLSWSPAANKIKLRSLTFNTWSWHDLFVQLFSKCVQTGKSSLWIRRCYHPLELCFSNFNMHRDCPGVLLEGRFWFSGSAWSWDSALPAGPPGMLTWTRDADTDQGCWQGPGMLTRATVHKGRTLIVLPPSPSLRFPCRYHWRRLKQLHLRHCFILKTRLCPPWCRIIKLQQSANSLFWGILS